MPFPDHLQRKVYEAHHCLCEKNETITAEAIKNKVTEKGEKTNMLMEIFSEHNQKMAALVGKDFAPLTLKRYVTTVTSRMN